MKEITLADVETAIKSIAATALKNEQYFCELDSFAGDADFGVSLASGFRVVEKEWNDLDRSSIGAFLLKISMIITSNVGGCSGPIWGTGVHARRRAQQGPQRRSRSRISTRCSTAAIEGIQKRGGAQLGDKTLLDALIPIRDIVHEAPATDADPRERAAVRPRQVGERGDRAHQGLGREARPAAVHGRPQRGHAGSGHRRDRDDDERHLRQVRRARPPHPSLQLIKSSNPRGNHT